jgi:tetratricopeptide (TPR) repeat protein
MLAGAKLQPIRLRIRGAKGKSNWLQVLEAGEDAFHLHPWDVGTAMDTSEAALGLKLPELAQWLMESVQVQAANDAHYWRHMAHVYEANQAFQKAIACWERVKKIAPHDEEASRKINGLSASATIARSGMQEAIQRAGQPVGRAGPEADLPDEAEAMRGAAGQTPEQRFQREVAAESSNSRPYLDLAAHYRSQGRLDEAREILARGLQACPDDPYLRDIYADLQLERLRKAVEALDRHLKDMPGDAEAKSKRAKLAAKLADYDLAEARRKVEKHPEDAHLRYDLGIRLARAGQHDAAIQEFQAARSSPALKVKALLAAGQSFEANGVFKLAERSYQDALKSAEEDDIELRNQLHYRLGRVAEELGHLEDAETHYNEVAANNYGYLDVAARLRSLNQRQSR